MPALSVIWQRLASNGGHFEPEHPDYRRAYLVNAILVVLGGVLLLFAILNVTLGHYPRIALIDLGGATACAVALWHFQRSHALERAAGTTVLIYLAVLLAFLAQTQQQYYAFQWLSLCPPIVLFLLGRRHGLIVMLMLMAGATLHMIHGMAHWSPASFGIESVLNIGVASLAQIALIHYYELSKEESHAALQRRNGDLARLSRTDGLTGLLNRQGLDSVLDAAHQRAGQDGTPLAIVLIDIDRFKAINDRHGHLAGDAALVAVARLLSANTRPGDTVGRWGGEEFLVICPATGLPEAQALAEILRQQVQLHQPFEATTPLTLSLGVTVGTLRDTRDTLLRRADMALYEAKARGRNRVETIVGPCSA